MQKVRKKLRDQTGEHKIRTVWRTPCKIGTTNLTVGYFFEEPEVGKSTYVCRDMGNETAAYRAKRVYIDDINAIGVFCTPM